VTTLWIVLSIIAAIIALVVLLLVFGRVKIRILCREKVKVTISVLGIRLIHLNDEKKKKKTKALTQCRHPDRVLKRELRKRKKAARAARKKREKARRKALKKKQKQGQATPAKTPTLKENISTIFQLLKKILKLSQGKLALRVRRLKISVGSDDAAKTAILYGAISQSAAYLLEWVEHNFSKVRYSEPIEVIPDYLSSRSHAEIDLICSFHIIVGIRMLIAHGESGLDLTKKAPQQSKTNEI